MLGMEDTEKSKNKRMAIKISKYKDLRYFDRKVSFFIKIISTVIYLLPIM